MRCCNEAQSWALKFLIALVTVLPCGNLAVAQDESDVVETIEQAGEALLEFKSLAANQLAYKDELDAETDSKGPFYVSLAKSRRLRWEEIRNKSYWRVSPLFTGSKRNYEKNLKSVETFSADATPILKRMNADYSALKFIREVDEDFDARQQLESTLQTYFSETARRNAIDLKHFLEKPVRPGVPNLIENKIWFLGYSEYLREAIRLINIFEQHGVISLTLECRVGRIEGGQFEDLDIPWVDPVIDQRSAILYDVQVHWLVKHSANNPETKMFALPEVSLFSGQDVRISNGKLRPYFTSAVKRIWFAPKEDNSPTQPSLEDFGNFNLYLQPVFNVRKSEFIVHSVSVLSKPGNRNVIVQEDDQQTKQASVHQLEFQNIDKIPMGKTLLLLRPTIDEAGTNFTMFALIKVQELDREIRQQEHVFMN